MFFFKKKKLDMLICIVPKLNPDAPTVGPALLKSHLLAAGFSCEVIDLNIQLYNHLKPQNLHNKYYFENDQLFNSFDPNNDLDFSTFYKNNEELFLSWVRQIKLKRPKYVGLSLLTRCSRSIAITLSTLIRKHLPGTKIVWGGPIIEGLAEKVKDQNLYDHYISGDGEFSIIELLKENFSFPGIDSPKNKQVEKLDSILVPNYDDIRWGDYERDNYPNTVYITGSRGCVRKCTFCNVSEIWPIFRHRSASHIINEIKVLKNKYNRKTFRFTDSLINGSRRSYRELLIELKKIKDEDPEFGWISQWIIRPERHAPENEFKLLKESGCLMLEVGLESFNEDVRLHMGKKFSNDDIDWCFSMFQKYKIPHAILMIVGYPIETESAHIETLQKIEELHQIGYMKTRDENQFFLLNLSFTNTMLLDISQPVWNDLKHDICYTNELEWSFRDNDLPTRVKRLNEINQLIKKLKGIENLNWQVEKVMREHNQAIKKI